MVGRHLGPKATELRVRQVAGRPQGGPDRRNTRILNHRWGIQSNPRDAVQLAGKRVPERLNRGQASGEHQGLSLKGTRSVPGRSWAPIAPGPRGTPLSRTRWGVGQPGRAGGVTRWGRGKPCWGRVA